MATTKNKEEKKEKETVYKITVKDNPNYCGVGAGSLQFAYGTTTTTNGVLAEWYKEHKGYTVTEE